MMAATVALAGCHAAPSPAGAPFAGQAAQDASPELAAAMLDEQAVGDYDYMIQAARGARYSVAQADASPRGAATSEEKKQRNAERLEALRAAVAARLAEKAETAQQVKNAHDQAEETTDEKGNKTRAFQFKDERSRSVDSEVKVGAEGSVVYSRHVVSQSNNGGSREIVRTREVQNDGTIQITFHREHTFRDGRTNVADWAKTISPEGGVSGGGTITIEKKDGSTKTIALTFGGTVEATTGQGQNDDAEVTLPSNGHAYGKGGKPVNGENEED